MIKKEQITGIILAGGKGRRMGSEKGMVPFMGKPLIEHALRVCQTMCGQILISANTGVYDHYGFPVIPDTYPDSGPMGGIYSCLCHSKTEKNIVLSCDTPFITEEFLRYLLSFSDVYDIVAPWHEKDHFEPLCAYYKRDVRSILKSFILRTNYRIPDVFKVVKFLPLKIDDKLAFYQERLFYNINTPGDLHNADKNESLYPNVMLVAGSGRNVGKSTLVYQLIEKFKSEKVIAIKISPHFHDGNTRNLPYIISREINPDNPKDSSRFLMAGAADVYYLQVHDLHVKEAFEMTLNRIKDKNKRPLIVESGGLSNFITPGLLLFVTGENNSNKNLFLREKADMIMRMQQGRFELDRLSFSDGQWKMM